MSEEFTIDVESMAQFRLAARRALSRVDDQRRMASYAGLAPGAFTRTTGGNHCDQSHAALVSCVGDLLDVAGQVCGALAEVAASAVEAYQGTDDANASAITDVGMPPDRVRGYEL